MCRYQFLLCGYFSIASTNYQQLISFIFGTNFSIRKRIIYLKLEQEPIRIQNVIKFGQKLRKIALRAIAPIIKLPYATALAVVIKFGCSYKIAPVNERNDALNTTS